MWSYLEIQSFFKDTNPGDLLIEEDLYIRFLFEPVPEEFLFKQMPKTIFIKGETAGIKKHEQNKANSFSYKQYYSSPAKLNDLFDSLKKFNLIAQNTSLTDFKGCFQAKKLPNQ